MVTEIHHCPEALTAPESVHPLLARKGDHTPAVRCPATFRDRKSSRSYTRYVGRMCSFTLIGRLYLSGKWLVVKNGHQNRHVPKDIGLCAQNIDTILGSIVVTKLRGPM